MGLLIGYCVLIVAASLGGGAVPMVVKLTHKRLQVATSLIGGFMLGVALLHLLPHALEVISASAAGGWLLGGILTMFLLERFFHFHHHELAETERDPEAGHDAHCDHDHVHVHEHRLSWGGAAIGLTLHSLIAGAALAASVAGEAEQSWAGVTVFLVIVLHKPLDAMTLLTLMRVSRWSQTARHAINALFALAVPAGAAIFFLGAGSLDVEHNTLVGIAVAFATGMFLCIALSDLLPELQFHAHDKVKITLALLLGVALSWGISLLESAVH